MSKTYDPIQSHTLASNQASVTFNSIPGTFTDLILVVNAGASVDDNIGLRFNADSGTNYSRTQIWGNGSTAGSNRQTNQTTIIVDQRGYPTSGVTNSSLQIFQIMNYSNTTTNKTVIGRANNPDPNSGLAAGVGLWRNTAAITSITVVLSGSIVFLTGSTFTLYGIKAE